MTEKEDAVKAKKEADTKLAEHTAKNKNLEALLADANTKIPKPRPAPKLFYGKKELLPQKMQKILPEYESYAGEFRLSDGWEGNTNLSEANSDVKIDLDRLKSDWLPKKIKIWYSGLITGLRIDYANGEHTVHGEEKGTYVRLELDDGHVKIRSVYLVSRKRDEDTFSVVDQIEMTTNRADRVGHEFFGKKPPNAHYSALEAPPGFSLRGFWSQTSKGIDRLGLIWGKDKPMTGGNEKLGGRIGLPSDRYPE